MRFIKRWTGSTSDEVLIAKANKEVAGKNVGAIKKITMVNSHLSNTTRTRLYLDDGTNEYDIITIGLPPMSRLVLDDNLGYNGSLYDLKLTLGASGYDITITIK